MNCYFSKKILGIRGAGGGGGKYTVSVLVNFFVKSHNLEATRRRRCYEGGGCGQLQW